MPHLHLIVGTGTAQRKLIDQALGELASRGYELSCRQEGGVWRDLLADNSGGGLFSDKNIAVVDEAEKLGAMPNHLATALEPPDAATVILLVLKSDTPAVVPKSLIDRCTRTKATAAPPPWARERDEAILAAAKAEGVSVKREAVAQLKELFEDMGELESEARKLAAYCSSAGRKEITSAEVEVFCLSDGSRNLIKLLDGLCAGNAVQTLVSLEALSRDGELLPLLSAIHNRMRLALYAAIYGKESAMFVKAIGGSDYAARLGAQAAKLYGKEKLLAFVTSLLRMNANEKSGRGAGWYDLTSLVVDLMA